MAKRAHKKPAKGAAPPPGHDDLTVMHPELPVSVAGRDLVMREYGFVEGLRLRPVIEPMLQDMETLLLTTPNPTTDQMLDLMGNHIDSFQELLAVASDMDVTFIAGLSQADGMKLADAWWVVNGPFYWRTAVSRAAVQRVQERLKADGQTSTQPSSGTDTSAPTSAATPSDS